MTYCKDEIQAHVNKLKVAFIRSITAILLLMLAALIMIVLNLNKAVTFILLIAEPMLLLLLSLTIEKYTPTVLFSREIKGTNIKEDEYTVIRKSGPGMRYKQVGAPSFGGPPIAPSTGANKRRTPPALRAAVYLRLEDGNVAMIKGLYKIHADIYEDGDLLFKHAGTRYPIVLNRVLENQPCPICGEVNGDSDLCCKQCGLKIIKDTSSN